MMTSFFPSSTLDRTVATAAFRKQRVLLLNLMQHSLLQISNSLLAESIISREVYKLAINEKKGCSERSVALLDYIDSRIEAVPSDFTKIVNILKAVPFLEPLADAMTKSYSKCEGRRAYRHEDY
jgi:hypothetical protein